jgi:hypothetical protein
MSTRSIARYLIRKSMDTLEAEGWTLMHQCESTAGQFSKDAWGIIDLMAFRPNAKPLFVQVTSAGNIQARVRKIRECIHLPLIMACCDVQAFGWQKKQGRWSLHRRFYFDVGNPYGYENKEHEDSTRRRLLSA